METKSIRVTKETYDELSKLGDLNDSFDSVIKQLLLDAGRMKNKK